MQVRNTEVQVANRKRGLQSKKNMIYLTLQLLLSTYLVGTNNAFVIPIQQLLRPHCGWRISSQRLASVIPSSSTPRTPSEREFDTIAGRLLENILELRSKDIDTSLNATVRKLSNDYRKARKDQQQYIESMIDQLSRSEKSYYPSESLFGPAYCTVYTYSPNDPAAESPLWEKISLKADNLKGQQYYLRENSFDDVNGDNSKYSQRPNQLVNYAEVWGKTLSISAQATFEPLNENDNDPQETTISVTPEKNLFMNLLEFGRSPSSAAKFPSSMRSCPDVYDVTAYEAAISFGGGKVILPIPIEGSAQFVILYADPRLRIFVTPEAEYRAKGVGPWEKSGLIAVQIRSDLVVGSSSPLDWRK